MLSLSRSATIASNSGNVSNPSNWTALSPCQLNTQPYPMLKNALIPETWTAPYCRVD